MEGKDADFPVNPENFTPIAATVGSELIMLDGRKVEDLEVIEEDEEEDDGDVCDCGAEGYHPEEHDGWSWQGEEDEWDEAEEED